MIRNLNGLLKEIKELTDTEVFAEDIRQDEVLANPSFWIYEAEGEIEKSGQGVAQYVKKFYLFFVTRENKKLDEFKIINLFNKHGLFFIRTEVDKGKIADLDKEAKMITFVAQHYETGGGC